MSKFKVEIKETLCKVVEVEANIREQAEEIVFDQWSNSEHILDYEHFNSISFKAKVPQKQKDHER